MIFGNEFIDQWHVVNPKVSITIAKFDKQYHAASKPFEELK